MARSFRLYQKKRGHRRTGSHRIASLGELVFFAAFLAIGIAGAVLLLVKVIVPEWRANFEFVESKCVVLDRHVGEKQSENGTLYRPEFLIRYQVGDATHEIWTYDVSGVYSSGSRESFEAELAQFVVDRDHPRTYRCWYDPVKPYVAVLVRGYSWWVWVLAVLPVIFIVVGAGGVIYALLAWGKSAERQAAIAQLRGSPQFATASGEGREPFPTVPRAEDLTNSPGTKLKYRLPMGTSPGWMMFIAAVVCLGWNGGVVYHAFKVIYQWIAGQPDWIYTFGLLPFAAVGVGLAVWFARTVVLATGISPTQVEISDHPLSPGRAYRLFVSQGGRLRVNALEVALVCQEEATFQQGTNARTEIREVFRQPLWRREAFQIQHGEPFQVECELVVPAGAMHSFKSSHNAIHWQVVVQGDIAGWPNYRRAFPVIICPAPAALQGAPT